MSTTHPTSRDDATAAMIDAPALPGFVPAPATLPAPRVDIAQDRRERAALLLLAVAHGHTPEDIANGIASDVVEAFTDELARDEALALVDLLLEALQPLATL